MGDLLERLVGRGDRAALVGLVSELEQDRDRLALAVVQLKAENGQLRRSRHLAALRGDLRRVERAAADAGLLAALHVGGVNTARRAVGVHGLGQWRWEQAVAVLRLGRVYGRVGWLTTDPGAVAEGVTAGRAAAMRDPERWRLRLNKRHWNV